MGLRGGFADGHCSKPGLGNNISKKLDTFAQIVIKFCQLKDQPLKKMRSRSRVNFAQIHPRYRGDLGPEKSEKMMRQAKGNNPSLKVAYLPVRTSQSTKAKERRKR